MPPKPGKPAIAIQSRAAVAAAVAICVVSWYCRPPDAPPWYSIVPPLLAVTLALITNRIFTSLGAAVVVGGLLSVPGSSGGWMSTVAHGVGGTFLWAGITDRVNLLILLYIVFIMAAISVMLVGGGLQGVAAWLMKFARTARSTQLATFAAGLIIFIDDYANTMIVGSTLRPLTDRQRISREKLAFLVDATAAPIAGIAVVSTWIGVEVSLLSDVAVEHGVGKDGYAIFFDALGFRFYCIGMVAFVFFNALSGGDFGPMAKAERRAEQQGKLLDDDARPLVARSLSAAEPHPDAVIHASVAIVPMGMLLTAFLGGLWFNGGGATRLAADPVAWLRLRVWREVLAEASSIPLLAYASAVGLLAAVVLARHVARVPWPAVIRAVVLGVRGSLLPVTVLILAWSLKGACEALQTGNFLAEILGDTISPRMFPALVFLVAGVTSFATGTSWGTMSILIPTAIPVALKLDGEVYGPVTILSVAAVLDGAIFGDHCSPISDTTIMSSTASSCDHLAHVRTQIPYSLTVAGIALCGGYLPAAFGASNWLGILGGTAISGLLFFTLRLTRR
ncbi:MAG: hypothetical protein JXB62_13615 [Pirellulales bacterium]|nr:hypothetical protein [Pirellulales bacterium]